MNELKLRITGIAPLLMHNNRGANPLSIYAKTMKPLTSKRNKTDEDHEELARLDWEAGLYLHNGEIALPARCIEKTFLMGARKSKLGKQYESGAFLYEDNCPLSYKGTQIKAGTNGAFPDPELDKYFAEYSNTQMVKVGTNQIPRCRPIFEKWGFECTLMFDSTIIEKQQLIKAAEDAGRLVGLLEQRPRLGRFEVEVV